MTAAADNDGKRKMQQDGHSSTSRISASIRMVRAANPSPMTADGTNTYIVGSGDVAIIDPGPAIPAHADAILRALQPDERVSAILVTHAHLDHSALAAALAARTDAPVLAFGAAAAGRSAMMTALAARGETGGEGVDADFRPARCIEDGETVRAGALTLTAIHTPGHMANHLSFAYGDVIFSGDQAMGWSTTLVDPPDGDMADYMASLARLAAMRPRMLLPGHGGAVHDAVARLDGLAAHRRTRETQILQALRAGPAISTAIAAQIYTDIPPALQQAAARNVFAHLIDLMGRNVVVSERILAFDGQFALA